MRDPIENISRLQMQLNDLQVENQILKNLLDRTGIFCQKEILCLRAMETLGDYAPNQGERIQPPKEITEKWLLCFIRDLGLDRIFMPKEMRRMIRYELQ